MSEAGEHKASPEDGWGWYTFEARQAVEDALRGLVAAIVKGQQLRLMDDDADLKKLTAFAKHEMHRLADTDAFQQAVVAELGFDPTASLWNPPTR